jgi:erythromycin esterase-like protein
MRSRSGATLALALLLWPTAVSSNAPTSDPVVTWMKRTAKPFDTCAPRDDQRDLAFLDKLVGNAHIVALGEGTHGTSEFFQMKHRIVRYLATKKGFTVFAIEANMPEAYRVNDYVLTGRGDAKSLLNGMYFWTWNTQEVLDMIEWMRAYNAAGKGRIQFTGFDMQTPDTAAAIVRRALARVDTTAVDSLDACVHALVMSRTSRFGGGGFGTATSTLPVADLAGHHVRYSGWIRTRDVSTTGWAGLWMRADSATRTSIAFDNMQGQHVNGTRDWSRYSIELDIPGVSTNVNFGCLMAGTGDAWFDSLAIEIDGRPWPGIDTLDLALEHPGKPAGFRSGGVGGTYEITMDDQLRKTGMRSLHLQRAGSGAAPEVPVAAVQRLLARLEGERAMLAAATSPSEADWVIQNMRVLEQCTRLAAPGAPQQVRDESMATNVDWILAHEKPGTRIVLWAHNGHVNREQYRMGSYLADKHGADMVVLGFATYAGQYTAVDRQKGLIANPLAVPDGDTFENLCHDTGLPRFVLDLRQAQADTAAGRWFGSPRPMRSIGAVATPMQFNGVDLPHDFDAIVFVDSTTPTRLVHPR